MVDLTESLVKEATKYYLFANTVAYLYKNLRRLNGVQELAHNYGAEAIVTELTTLLSANEKIGNVDIIVKIYALIVALSFKDYSEVRVSLEEISKIQIEWIGSLANHCKKSMVSESITSITTSQLLSNLFKTNARSPDVITSSPTHKITINTLQKT